MTLTEKQRKWLRAALIATAREGPVFKRVTLRAWLGLPIEESAEIARSLERDALVTLLPTDEAILTDQGKRVASSLDAPPLPPSTGPHRSGPYNVRQAGRDLLSAVVSFSGWMPSRMERATPA
jgi:hypothetical protein